MTEKYFVAAGYGDTGQSSNLIVLKITDNGKIQIKQEFYYDGGPSYLVEKVISDHRSCIYAAFEKTNEIVKFVWENGILTEEKRFQAPGEGLCHLCLSEDCTMLYGSCYMSGDYFAVDTELSQCIWIKKGQKDSHAHCIYKGKENRIYLVDLGLSSVCRHQQKEKSLGECDLNFPIHVGEGPRQILLWNLEKNAVVINESSSTLSFWQIKQQGTEQQAQRICTRNTTKYIGNNAPGDAVIWNEKILFVGNRGAETVSAFSLERLGEKIGEWDCGGKFPRGLFVSDEGVALTCCQKSGKLVSCRWDEEKAQLDICDSLNLPGAANVIEITAEEEWL